METQVIRVLDRAVLHELLGRLERRDIPGHELLRRLWAGPVPRRGWL